jgi:hypothetical protein
MQKTVRAGLRRPAREIAVLAEVMSDLKVRPPEVQEACLRSLTGLKPGHYRCSPRWPLRIGYNKRSNPLARIQWRNRSHRPMQKTVRAGLRRPAREIAVLAGLMSDPFAAQDALKVRPPKAKNACFARWAHLKMAAT